MGKQSANKVLSVREFERQPQTFRILRDERNEGAHGRGSPKKHIPESYNVGGVFESLDGYETRAETTFEFSYFAV